MPNPREILKQYWGYDNFRPLQEEIITATIENRDVLALLPTSGGKSICFQIPALAKEGLCLVVSPLIALIKDQVDQLKKRGIPAEMIFSGMSAREIDITLDKSIYGKVKFLYVSPERLQTDIMRERICKMKINLLAIDEAHCISQWGYDFRPPYLEILEFRKLIPTVNTIALTATATDEVKKDIISKLALKDVAIFQKSFIRENLAYIIQNTEDKLGKLLHILKKISGSAIVYAGTRKKTKEIATFLSHNNISATHYNAGLSAAERDIRQENWIQNKTRVIVATNAFGMGIDKPDVRLIVHMDLPTTLEAYYQEAGRAGRDEQKSYAVLLYEKNDSLTLKKNLEITNPTIDQIKALYQHLANHYSIAIGSHAMITYDFDLQDFCEKYSLNSTETYQTLKILEQQNLLQVNETFFERSKVHLDISTRDLYAFQVANSQFDLLIKALLRLYGGDIFSSFMAISEKKIATTLNSTSERVVLKLNQLHKLGILNYSPQKDKPQLTFTQERFAATQIPIDLKFLKQRQELSTQKCQAMLNYATHQHRCRQQILLEYFGEISYAHCNKCDICLARQKKILSNKDYEKFRQLILATLKKSPHSINDIVSLLNLAADQDALDLVQDLINSEEIKYNETGLLEINKNH